MQNLEETIRERAYHLWLADGQPEGKADIHWMNAQHEIAASVATSATAGTVAAKPARTRSRKK
jgi:hypothetical protein